MDNWFFHDPTLVYEILLYLLLYLFKNHIKFYYIEEKRRKKQNRLVQLIFASRYDRSC